MRIPIPEWYDKAMDRIACLIFPPPTVKIAGISLLDLTLWFYFVAMAAGLWWWFEDWRWAALSFVCCTMLWAYERWGLR